jgi:uncharacterized protein (TIGR02145 family)
MRTLLTSLLCVFTLSLTAQESCPNVFDYDNDGNVAVNDFIAMLSYFGDSDSDSDGVWDSEDDCLDIEACNYSANPSEPCGYFFDAVGICGGNCPADEDADGVCDFDCGELFPHEGYDYSTVQIGDQCWFSENCRYLPEVSPPGEISVTDPYYYVYYYFGTDVEAAKETTNYETYGVLYNWPAVMTEGICPNGWHIPSDEEYIDLADFLGGENEAGYAMKSSSGWNNSGNGSNSSGFTGLPGGFRNVDFISLEIAGFWWTSTDFNTTESYYRQLQSSNNTFGRAHYSSYFGFSARCVRD